MPEHYDIGALAPQPWKNGAGLTREIAVEPRGATTNGFDWRFSIAEVSRDAPFSAFPGIDRCITLLRGAGMRLVSADRTLDHALDQVHAPFHFSGDLALNATLFDGACSDFNVMVRGDAWRAEVDVLSRTSEVPDADATLLLAIDGPWVIEAGGTDHDAAWPLETHHALLWRARRGSLWATPTSPASALLQVRLCQHQRP